MPNIAAALNHAAAKLRDAQVAEPRREAVSLLTETLNKPRAFLIAHDDYVLTDEQNARFENLLARRAAREPLQYIRGHTEFYGLDFIVTPDVLIPRPETEILVEESLEILRNVQDALFCEIGTGSGCISVSVLANLADASAVGADISAAALSVTHENAVRHKVSERLELVLSNVFAEIASEKFDLIVSNPPYIALELMSDLQPEVKNFEPRTALTDESDGLSIIRKIIFDAPNVLKSNGFLLMEIGFGQARDAGVLFDSSIWQSIIFINDLQGIPRVLKAHLK